MLKSKEKFTINYIDPSSISTFNRCPAKYYLSRLLSIESKDNYENRHRAMNYGSDMHEVLPYCYKEETLQRAIDTFKKRWEDRNYSFDDKRNVDNAERSLIDFFATHKRSPYTVLQYPITAPTDSPISKNEIPFLIDIGGQLPLAGRMDCAVRWNSDNSLLCLDYKTSGEVSQRLFNSFENSPQVLGYTLALSHIADERAKGMIIEAIRVSKAKPETCLHIIFVKDCQLKQFVNYANRTSSKILECNNKKEWPMNCSACSPYSGFGMPGYLCEYIDICSNPDKEQMIKFYKKTPRYHPFNIIEEKETKNGK